MPQKKQGAGSAMNVESRTDSDLATRTGSGAVRGFQAVASQEPDVLVLGSMPGVISLREQQYYAHPRNAFWPIAAAVFGFEASLPYDLRLAALNGAGVALWDVLQACEREGSLDADIKADSVVPNDFAAFFASHPHIQRVCFNGAKAAALYRRHVLPKVTALTHLEYVALPSTSPAHAAAGFDAKLAVWRKGLTLSSGNT